MRSRHPNLRIAAAPGARDASAARRLLDSVEGERLLQKGVAGLRDALLQPVHEDGDTGWVAFWRGYVLQFDDLSLARAEWLKAEARFLRDGDAEGTLLTACGLVQSTLLDSQSYADFDARAARIESSSRPREDATPLGWFRLSAWLLLRAERRDEIDRATDDVERAFAALGTPFDREIGLRVAIAALPLLGLTLDRVRSEDFFQAGAIVAGSGSVGPYSRALWHLFVAEARSYDPTWSPRLRGELDIVDKLARAHDFPLVLARAHVLRAAIALGDGEVAAGRASLDAAHPLLDPAHPADYWAFHYYASRHALMAGDAEEAWEHAKLSHRRLLDAQVSDARTTPILMQQGFVLVALGRLPDAAAAFARAGDLSGGAQAIPCFAHVHLTRALHAWREGPLDEARAELTAAFVQLRSIDLTHFFRALPNVASELCGAALDLDADVPFVRKTIAARGLASPDLGIARWPWPLRVHALGGFAIERDGALVRFARKAPKRLLDLLRLITALGAHHVDAARVAATLWPDADGDEARDALKTMLHRTRTLLGADLLVVRDGQISFDDELTWVDTWAFEHVCRRIEALLAEGPAGQRIDDGELERRRRQLLALYRGHFLGEAELPSWALALRDRLSARFIRSIDALGQRLEHVGRLEQAIALYRAALEQDNLAEELYQRLMACHLLRGENAQALNAYRRCRELLSMVLGVKPSARTESLAARIASP